MSHSRLHKGFILLSVLTVMVQYYEYHLYGFMAAKIGLAFFPSSDPTMRVLKTYLAMTVAFIAKPLGAVYFGSKGDRLGRSHSFRMSILFCAIASLILYILPSHKDYGVFAVIVLILCRMVICASASAGSDGVRIFVYENVPANWQCTGAAVTVIFTQVGSLLAALSAWYFMQEEQAENFWRLPFLIGSLMGLSLVIASLFFKLQDADSGQNNTNSFERQISYRSLIAKNKRLFLLMVIVIGCVGSTNQFLLIFFSTYNFEVIKIISRAEMQIYLVVGILVYMMTAIFAGYLADRSKKAKMVIISCAALSLVMAFQAYYISFGVFNIGIFLFSIAIMPFIHMPISVILKAAAPKEVRYRFFSLAHAIGSVFISAPTSFVATLLYSSSGIAWLPVVYFIISLAIVAICLTRLVRTSFAVEFAKPIIGAT